MKVLRLTHSEREDDSGASSVYPADKPDALVEEIREMQYDEVGEKWIITVEEMSQKKFKALPEFTGW